MKLCPRNIGVIAVLLALATSAPPVHAGPGKGDLPQLEHAALKEKLEKKRPEKPADLRDVKYQLGDEFYVDIEELLPGQHRYSAQNVQKHLQEYVDDYGVTFEVKKEEVKWHLPKHAEGKLLPKEEAMPVVLTDHGYVLLDGHHHAMACIYVGCEKFPVYIAKDMRGMGYHEVTAAIRALGYTNYYRGDGAWHTISWFSMMEDDDMLMFVRRFRARIVMSPKGDLEVSGAKEPVWVAFRGDPYSEIKVADALRVSGFKLPKDFDGEITPELSAEIRRRLLSHVKRYPDSLPGIEIVKEATALKSLNTGQIYMKHRQRVREHPCIPYFREVAEYGPFLPEDEMAKPDKRFLRLKEKTGRK